MTGEKDEEEGNFFSFEAVYDCMRAKGKRRNFVELFRPTICACSLQRKLHRVK